MVQYYINYNFYILIKLLINNNQFATGKISTHSDHGKDLTLNVTYVT